MGPPVPAVRATAAEQRGSGLAAAKVISALGLLPGLRCNRLLLDVAGRAKYDRLFMRDIAAAALTSLQVPTLILFSFCIFDLLRFHFHLPDALSLGFFRHAGSILGQPGRQKPSPMHYLAVAL